VCRLCTANVSDFTLATQTLNFTGSSFNANNHYSNRWWCNCRQQAVSFVLSLENPIGLVITKSICNGLHMDNDDPVPVPSQQIELNYVVWPIELIRYMWNRSTRSRRNDYLTSAVGWDFLM
jgi:hypothetical protein